MVGAATWTAHLTEAAPMDSSFSRRDLLKTVTAGCFTAATANAASTRKQHVTFGLVSGPMTGPQAPVETLMQESTDCVFGIPGAQGNELWAVMKSKGLR